MAGKPFSAFTELSQATKDVLEAQGFVNATPVQEATIQLFAGNKDVAVDACTGSGKTLAFVLPIIEKMMKLEQPLKRHQVGYLFLNTSAAVTFCPPLVYSLLALFPLFFNRLGHL